jgi:hypothetical protein
MWSMSALDGLVLDNPCLFRARLSAGFTDDRPYGCHGGIDLTFRNSKDGLYLRPAYPGTKVKWGFDRKTGLGNFVQMQHQYLGVLFYTWYCHLEADYLPNWPFMDTRVMLGIAGATGDVFPVGPQGRHLHFALQVPGQGRSGCGLPSVIDPLPYFSPDVVKDWTVKR